MRRLMLLGGNRYQLPVIKAAHELGCYVITCDFLPGNIAHKYSDEYCNVSIIEKEEVLKKAKELKIDGIMSFGCDPGVITAAYVAEQLSLPSVGSYKAVSILQNKGLFRSFLKENGFNVPFAKHYNDPETALKDIDLFHWPVMVKPTDSAGSKGVTRVDSPDYLSAAIEYAMSKSFKQEFIIEEFLEKVGCSSDTDSFSIGGVFSFFSFNAQRFDSKASNPFAPAAYSWPSTISSPHQEELKSELQRLIALLDLGTSIYNIETRECVDGKAYIMECSPRGGGNRLAEMIKYATGIDLIKASILAALGDKVPAIEQKPINGYWAEIILHSDNIGLFNGVWFSDSLRQNVVEEDIWVKRGDKIYGFIAANEAIGTIILRFDEEDKMLAVLNNLDDHVRVIVK